MSLLDLPNEVLLLVLVYVGNSTLQDLAHVAATCRRLADFVYGRDVVLWRHLHAQRYDDPRRARAFIHQREPYDWRSAVIDRDWVTRAAALAARTRRSTLPARQPVVHQRVRYARVLLGLYRDFGGVWTSLNGLLLKHLRSPEFAFVAQLDPRTGESMGMILCSLRRSRFTRLPRLLPHIGGPGLLGVKPEGDWPGVAGRWRCDAYRFDASRVGVWSVGEYDVVPVSFDELQKTYAARSQRAAAHWKYLDCNTSTDMPAVYFIGEGSGLPHDSRGESLVGEHFVCGVVHLTTDNPPQVAWTWVLENTGVQVGYEDFVMVVEAVQVGGRCATAGLFGKYRDLYLYEGRGEGGVWMSKKEG
ncbi:hypothetical protein CC85DRAFT_310503 [Cutaneotrichosporon oleaginosum]|uniref:F-box domain-containing protein n=1 Tax=Cutaneotrichosporon oleaginosum TaxID=879819 RepID=A0A0J1BCM6_9TREE|nr:uncharacterized protein CC85DRAFT_310503 [Cutaneotrichosporon oleaginosum]KLT45784.1 hypothetical protein CC85DRAFT_310503 [Cutaneotrichosporon oleaginosum]TXT04453.1 hypothetical protein COLE_07272 [Cutaneotrichosporon oleaginosum]